MDLKYFFWLNGTFEKCDGMWWTQKCMNSKLLYIPFEVMLKYLSTNFARVHNTVKEYLYIAVGFFIK